jgi:hypothetical protein
MRGRLSVTQSCLFACAQTCLHPTVRYVVLLHKERETFLNKHASVSARVDLGAPFDDALQSASKDAMYDASNHIYEDANFVYEDFGGTRLTLLR